MPNKFIILGNVSLDALLLITCKTGQSFTDYVI